MSKLKFEEDAAVAEIPKKSTKSKLRRKPIDDEKNSDIKDADTKPSVLTEEKPRKTGSVYDNISAFLQEKAKCTRKAPFVSIKMIVRPETKKYIEQFNRH